MNSKTLFKSLESNLVDYHLPPFSNYSDLSKEGVRVITHGKGNYIFDNNNNKILDAMAGLWCVNIGYGREEIAEVAKKQIKELAY